MYQILTAAFALSPRGGEHWSAVGGVTAALVGCRVSLLFTLSEAYTAVAPRPGSISRLSRIVTVYA